MDLDIRRDDGEASVHVSGALDLMSSADLYRALADLQTAGARAIRLDLSRLDFVDSSGLAALLRWQTEAAQRGEEFIVHGARGLVRRVLRGAAGARRLGA